MGWHVIPLTPADIRTIELAKDVQSLEREQSSTGDILYAHMDKLQLPHLEGQMHWEPNSNAQLYVNTSNMGNKQGELELCMQLQSYDLMAITETWWDNSHDWNGVMDGFELFKKNRSEGWGGRVTLYMSEQLECMELCLGKDEGQL